MKYTGVFPTMKGVLNQSSQVRRLKNNFLDGLALTTCLYSNCMIPSQGNSLSVPTNSSATSLEGGV